MDGVHDLGGKPGFNEVERQRDEPVFHGRWEACVFAMVPAAARAGAFANPDEFRHAIERIHPGAYLAHGYYGRWIGGIENLLVERGILTAEEIEARFLELGGKEGDLVAARPNPVPDPPSEFTGARTAQRDIGAPPAFKIGGRVRTRATPVPGHTRLPAYARGKAGEVAVAHGGWVYPDASAHGRGEQPTHLYTVKFSGGELFGAANKGFEVRLDLFEPYLESDREMNHGP